MRGLIVTVGLVVMLVLSGCAGFWEVTDALLSDPVIHSGTVKRVEMAAESTTVHFEDGISYTLKGSYYARPGDEAKITQGSDGYRLE